MFDANMRHLPKGKRFFASIRSSKDGSRTHNAGLRGGMLVPCEMLSSCHKNPRARFDLESGPVTLRHYEGEIDSWIRYEGNIDGTGFIREESRKQAMEQIEKGKACG